MLGLAAAGACKENLSPPPIGTGPDTSGPLVRLSPGRDTTVDSTGVLLINVNATDPSGIRLLSFQLDPPSFGYPSSIPLDTAVGVSYSIPLGVFKHSSFRFTVRATDVLDHETVTNAVTVTVR